ncbi:GH39 family glycosyl hydrolase [Nocardioides iriomotensis]|uniref:GH39 family glycosyl hydrolase n=1 Tax=Nocardioides iriomotensis TaxID=715784 RepID=UPI0013EA913A|nr:xylan 1,4-beta-xylosidase [Nocardioides iriomotensis]
MSSLRAEAGVGQVTLTWPAVADAVGYVVHHGAGPDSLAPLDHGGGDLLVVPCAPYADTRREAGGWYAVAPVRSVEDAPGTPGSPVHAEPLPADAVPEVAVRVDVADRRGRLPRPWRTCIGSEHLSHLLSTDECGGRPIGAESVAALARVHAELGVERVRAHGTLGDDLGVVTTGVDGAPLHDFSRLDAVLDTALGTGVRPVLELGWTPRALAPDEPWHEITPAGLADPPRDLSAWADLVEAFVRHLRERYGDDELARGWALEVWNEPNLGCFWTGDQQDYLDLYDASVAAIRRAHPTLPVAGPATAAVGWLDAFLKHAGGLDILTPHAYGIPPLDLRPVLARHGREDVAVWWTEWGPTPTHFHPVNDHPWVASFTARGMLAAARADAAVACWVSSDHFEELGRPPRLVHGGFGLLSVGNLAKPRFWALRALELLGDEEVGTSVSGDGAESLVQAWAGVDPDRVAVTVWNGSLQQHDWAEPRDDLRRTVRLDVAGLASGRYAVRHRRVDADHSHLAKHAADLGVAGWPDEDQWHTLRGLDVLADLPAGPVDVGADGTATLMLDLPTSALSLVELTPASQ